MKDIPDTLEDCGYVRIVTVENADKAHDGKSQKCRIFRQSDGV